MSTTMPRPRRGARSGSVTGSGAAAPVVLGWTTTAAGACGSRHGSRSASDHHGEPGAPATGSTGPRTGGDAGVTGPGRGTVGGAGCGVPGVSGDPPADCRQFQPSVTYPGLHGWTRGHSAVARRPGSHGGPARRSRLCVMVAPTLTFAESYAAEDLVLQTARSLADEVGLDCVTPGAGAALRLLAAAGAPARSSRSAPAPASAGSGCCAACAPTACSPRSTSRPSTSGSPAGSSRRPGSRRAAPGSSPAARSTCCPGSPTAATTWSSSTPTGPSSPPCVQAALRLLRPGGVLAVNGALARGRIGDPAARDPDTVAVRETAQGGTGVGGLRISALVRRHGCSPRLTCDRPVDAG